MLNLFDGFLLWFVMSITMVTISPIQANIIKLAIVNRVSHVALTIDGITTIDIIGGSVNININDIDVYMKHPDVTLLKDRIIIESDDTHNSIRFWIVNE